jgi:hypothetical protein
MKTYLLLLLLIPLSSWAQVKGEISGNVEAQTRHTWNNQAAQDDLAQDWEEENFHLFYGNLNGKLQFKGSRLESNVFARHSQSNLYQDPKNPAVSEYIAPKIFTFPQKLVARDVFKLQYTEEGSDYRSELILNKLFYVWDYEEHRFMIGRMYINYGQGEIFNPINPFNQPTGLTAISQVAQGNDGFNFEFFVNDKYTVDFYFLGDKSLEGYDGQIDRTMWIHGEYQASDELQLDYVVGEDQRRHKLGGQIRYNFSKAQVFAQALYQTDFVDDKESHPLWDALLGYDQQVTNKWHVRLESGYQKKNRFLLTPSFGERFLPTEYFVALANQFEVHPLVKLTGTIVNDVKTGFTYFITRNTVDLGHNMEFEIFGYIPAAKGSDIENPAQKLVTTDVGAALRAFF